MKKIALILSCICMTLSLVAQPISEPDKTALQLIQKNQKSLGFSDDDIQNIKIQNSYFEQTLQAQLLYILPTHKGLIVHNQYQVLVFKDGILVNKAGNKFQVNKLPFPNVEPSIDAQTAIQTAIADRKLPAAKQLRLKDVAQNAALISFEDLNVSKLDISAQLMWVRSKTGPEVFLAWQITLVPNSNSDYWQIRVDAHTNRVIDVTNLTVYCKWDDPAHANLPNHVHIANPEMDAVFSLQPAVEEGSPDIIQGASYRVIPFPAESPSHPGGSPSIVTNPWEAAPGNATSLKWHSNGSADYTFTRGNNVWAKEDHAANNSNSNQTANSTTNDPLSFDFIPNFTVDATQSSPVPNQQFNTTNLFYWNNILHDISYLYGFDEPAGNFQANNQGRGGFGNDFVHADAQDGSGFNNANFSTPPDGGNGRMQMFLWGGSPRRDGDVDNGVVAHEFTHGISQRLTGGGSSGCLGSAEQMGEGWSDYISLMLTQNWATSTLNDGFDKPRGIGTYLMGQTNSGAGIRTQRYCTNLAINNKMFTTNLPNIQHDRGEIWCATLWDMTWNIIQQTASITPNIYDVNGMGGNIIAMKLVMQGMKLQPCDPGFLDGRDGILAADQLLYGGQYRCAIISAFARRGMGFNASQGSVYSLTDQSPGFSNQESTLSLTQSVTQQAEGQQVTYTHTVTAGACSGLSNYVLRDTLPANVNYVSGGTYDAVNRVVSFAVNVTTGNTASFAYTVSILAGSYYPTETLLNETVVGTGLPGGWTTGSISTLNWESTSAKNHSPANSLFANDNGTLSDFNISTNTIAMGTNPAVLSFWHLYDTEESWDGGVLEISTNNGTTWADLGNHMVENPYNTIMGTGSAIAGRSGFSGNSNGFIKSTVFLDEYINQNIRLRFRFASDNNTAADGWYVDDIVIKKEARVNIHSTLFNATNAPVATQDTFTLIVENPLACTPVQINTEPPANVNACPNTNISFGVQAVGSNPAYQWQVSSTGCAGTFVNIAGAQSATYTLNNVTTALNNNVYRVIISNDCPSADTSICIVLSVNNAISINTQPGNAVACTGQSASFTAAASGTGVSYQWQVSNNGGSSFSDIANANSATLILTNLTAGQTGNLYRVMINSTCSASGTSSSVATLTVNNPVTISAQPANISKCIGNDVSFQVTASGTGISYQWQRSTDAGNSFTDMSGATLATYSLANVQLAQNGYRFRVMVSSTTCAGAQSAAALLSVTPPPTVTISASGNTGITPNTQAVITATVTPAGNYTYQWQLNGENIPGATSVNQTVSIDKIGDYTVRVIDPETGCTAISNAVQVAESASDLLYVYPSPNNGSFIVRYYSSIFNISRLLNVYDSKGARVYSKKYSIDGAYTRMPVNLLQASAGMYLVELLDEAGNRIALKKILIQ